MRNALYIKRIQNFKRLQHLTDEYPLIWFYLISACDRLGIVAHKATEGERTLLLAAVNANLKLHPVAR